MQLSRHENGHFGHFRVKKSKISALVVGQAVHPSRIFFFAKYYAWGWSSSIFIQIGPVDRSELVFNRGSEYLKCWNLEGLMQDRSTGYEPHLGVNEEKWIKLFCFSGYSAVDMLKLSDFSRRIV